MKQRLISIFLLSVFLICSLMPGASAGAPAFDEGALSQYLNAWQQQYTAENFREIDLEDSLMGEDETRGFLVYGRDYTFGYDFDTLHFFAIIPTGGDFRENLQDFVIYAGDSVLRKASLDYDEELGYVVELTDVALETLLSSDEFTIRLSYSDSKDYIDIARDSHAVLYQMARHVADAVDYCVPTSRLYLSSSLLPATGSNAPNGSEKDTGFVDDYVVINEKAQSMFLVEIYDEKNKLLGTGSGFVAFDEHLFITNHHVIEGAAYLIVYDDLDRSHRIDYLIAADEPLDIAILEFDAGFEYEALALQENTALLRGQPVIAIGSPKGVKNTVSSGNISAILHENGAEIIQFTAPASHGSSGGALFDNTGSIIGLVFAKHAEGENMNYALNIQSVIEFRLQNMNTRAQLLATYNHLTPAPVDNGRVNNIGGGLQPEIPQQTDPDSGYARYTHPVLGYTLEYPAGWVMMDSSNVNSYRSGKSGLDLSGLDWDTVAPQILDENMTAFADYLGVSSDFDLLDFSANLTVSVRNVGTELTADDYISMMPDIREQYTESIPDIEFINEGSSYSAGGKEFCLLSYSYPTDDYLLYNYQFYISGGDMMYVIGLTLADNVIDLDLVETYTDHLLETLKFPAN